jgi:TetR/AcrR family transcriptional regulator, regulator of mycofactocin system
LAAKSELLFKRKQQLVRDAIWDAAIDLFAAKGFDKVTVDNIAAAADVSQRTFFRYFASKNDLMSKVYCPMEKL